MRKIFTMIIALMMLPLMVKGENAINIWDGSIASNFSGGNGTKNNPYLISSGAELAKLANDVNNGNSYKGMYFRLMDDIILNDKLLNDEGNLNKDISDINQWISIGSSFRKCFEGSFDGSDFVIKGMYIMTSILEPKGLWGYINNATIKNVVVEDSYIEGRSGIGGIIGFAEKSIISDCSSNISIIQKDYSSNAVGGIIGKSINTSITYCKNKSRIKGICEVGGIVGEMSGGLIEHSQNYGILQGVENYLNSTFGGIVGSIDDKAEVIHCENFGSIVGLINDVGGIAGCNENGIISQCYNEGKIKANNSVGGILGSGSNIIGTVLNCYNKADLEGYTVVGGIVGLSYNSIKYCYNIGTITVNSDRGISGGIVGEKSGMGYPQFGCNCYYLENTADGGVAGNDIKGLAEVCTKDQFIKGIVAWLLQKGQSEQVWGQNLGNEEFPAWQKDYNKVIQLSFIDGSDITYRWINGGLVTLPVLEKDGYTFFWSYRSDGSSKVDKEIYIYNDLTFYAVWIKEPVTGIESIEGVKVYTKDGSLFVQTSQREQVLIISMLGSVIKNDEQTGLKQYYGLNPGIYVVRVGDQVFKVCLK
ncbi:MAG: hypothetical protein KIH02_07975 [Parabacteroides sp.]|nr:hypothetical protein [Parabacteroides sp.]MDY5623454.1 GLUG motif-containing protein [Bacteroidales bacterium]